MAIAVVPRSKSSSLSSTLQLGRSMAVEFFGAPVLTRLIKTGSFLLILIY